MMINGFSITFDIDLNQFTLKVKKIASKISTKKILEGICTESITRASNEELTMKGGM